jgi:hypothetical protein
MDNAAQSLLDVVKASKDALAFIEKEVLALDGSDDAVSDFIDEFSSKMTAIQQWEMAQSIRLLALVHRAPQNVIDNGTERVRAIEANMMKSA